MDMLERLFCVQKGLRRYNKTAPLALTGSQVYIFVMLMKMDKAGRAIDKFNCYTLMKQNGRWPNWPVLRQIIESFVNIGYLTTSGKHRLHVTETARKEYKRINTVLTEARIRTKKSDTGLSRRGRDRAAKLKKPLRLGDDTED